jgi:hypothetical protein
MERCSIKAREPLADPFGGLMKREKTRVLLVTVTVGALVASVAGSATGQTPPSTVVGQTGNLVPNGGFDVGRPWRSCSPASRTPCSTPGR